MKVNGVSTSRRRSILAAACVVLLAVSTAAQQVKTAPSRSPTRQELDSLKTQVTAAVERLRGLRFKRPVTWEMQDRAQLRRYLIKLIRQEFPENRLQAYDKVLKKFGVIPEDLDLERCLIELLTEQIAGFYDQRTKKFFLMKGAALPIQKVILAHELTHVLQDQYFDLNSLGTQDKENDDLALAAQSLVEGDAMRVMADYVFQEAAASPKSLAELMTACREAGYETEQLESAPEYLKRNLIFPYLQGDAFVKRIFSAGGQDLLDIVFCKPPCSTEQIMHPEKFLERRDDPVIVKIPDLAPVLGAGWKELLTNVIGEFNIKVMFDIYSMGGLADTASRGWDGDRFRAYLHEPTGKVLLAWVTTWDSPCDADEFYDIYRSMLDRRYDRHRRETGLGGDMRGWLIRTEDGMAYVERVRGKQDVIVLDGFPLERLRPIREVVLQATKQPYRPKRKVKPPKAADRIRSEQSANPLEGLLGKMGQELGAVGAAAQMLSGEKPDVEISGDVFRDKTNGFSLRKPPGWRFVEEISMSLLPVTLAEEQGRASANVAVFPMNLEPVDMWLPLLEATLTGQFQDFKKISGGPVTFHGGTAHELIYTGKKMKMAMKIRQLIFASGGRTYVMTFAATEDSYDQVSQAFDAIAASFKTTKPARGPAREKDTKK